MNWLPAYNYILASNSARRQELLKLLGIEFVVKVKEVDETYQEELSKYEIPQYLARKKAGLLLPELKKNDLLITADTIVCLDDEVLGKPGNYDEAAAILKKLSGREHSVISGVCLTSAEKQTSFYAETIVSFKVLADDEIDYYIKTFKPFDKAGAYGIQEWIGLVGVTSIKGSFYNVMGLPVRQLYEEILGF